MIEMELSQSVVLVPNAPVILHFFLPLKFYSIICLHASMLSIYKWLLQKHNDYSFPIIRAPKITGVKRHIIP